MAYQITNKAVGPRGIWAGGSLIWLEPGATKVIEPDDMASVRRNASFEFEALGDLPPVPKKLAALVAKQAADPLDHDGDGKPGGSPKGAASTRAKGAAKRKTTGRTKAGK